MSTRQLDQAVFGAVLPEDIDFEPFPAFPATARLAVVVGRPSEPAPYVVRVKVPSGVKLMPHRHHEDRVYTVMSGLGSLVSWTIACSEAVAARYQACAWER